MQNSKIRIIEINKNMPYTFGETEFLPDENTFFVQCDAPLLRTESAAEDARDQIIGRYIAAEIDDGACLQVGIGGIPNALCRFLKQKKHLGIHTEIMSDGLAELIECGAADGSKKTIDSGLAVTSTVAGDKVYEFIDKNAAVKLYGSDYTNNIFTLAKSDNQVSVNAALEIDLTGQCCSESLGSRHFSGTGGQCETAIGAQLAKGGKAFMVLRSTSEGGGGAVSKIVAQLKRGAAVSMPRNDMMFVVTEYGIVNLRGKSISERARLLISIAHPSFRDELARQACELGIIRHF